MCYIPDALDMLEAHEAEKEAELDKMPECVECGHKIQDEYAYYINDEWICDNCMDANYRKEVADYVG